MEHPVSTRAVPPIRPLPLEARSFDGALAHSEWTFQGKRNRIFLLVSGSGRLSLDRQPMPFAGPGIVWLPSGLSGSVYFEAGATGASLAIPETALGAAMPSGATFVQVKDMVSRPILSSTITIADARDFLNAMNCIARELLQNQPGVQEVVRHQLALLLISLWRRTELTATPKPLPSPRALVRGFVHMVELHMREHRTIADYANALSVTADRLNTAVRRVTGRSPAELIHGRLAAEAANLLDSSGLQISEIAVTLGFQDPAYFTRFFKRMTGQSPKEYRMGNVHRKEIAEISFAAWP
jgi:AraC family transcriptional activator of pobA